MAVDEERAIALKKEMYRLVTEDIEIEKRSMNTDDAMHCSMTSGWRIRKSF